MAIHVTGRICFCAIMFVIAPVMAMVDARASRITHETEWAGVWNAPTAIKMEEMIVVWMKCSRYAGVPVWLNHVLIHLAHRGEVLFVEPRVPSRPVNVNPDSSEAFTYLINAFRRVNVKKIAATAIQEVLMAKLLLVGLLHLLLVGPSNQAGDIKPV